MYATGILRGSDGVLRGSGQNVVMELVVVRLEKRRIPRRETGGTLPDGRRSALL